ncbi:MAG: UvrD-helicase domain-containing protein [Cyclobacteriaceae bacterium]
MTKPFHIYRSGAGSGKTYTLAKSYLKIALGNPDAFRNILGVTFTNKSTEEMKGRIVRVLKDLKEGTDQAMGEELCKELNINTPELKKRASGALSSILHNYGRFSVVTIDSFFNQVIRAFAREMGLQGTFTIDLDQSAVLEQVVDKMLLDIGLSEKKQLRSWLTKFAEIRVEDGKPWDFREEVKVLSAEILKDGFKAYGDAILKFSESPQQFEEIYKELNAVKFGFENQAKKICEAFYHYLDKEGLNIGDFTGKGNGPAGLFNKFSKLEFDITEGRRAANYNLEKWLTKANLKSGHLNAHLESFILPKYAELIDLYDSQYTRYISSIIVQRYLFTFGILAQVNRYIQQYRDENDVMLIADLPDFLHQIIHDSDTPFIYEKVGSLFQHYLIDEFQDTSSFQWDNFMPLVKNGTDEGNFSMVVGDVKQSIYRFRGGDWELLQNKVKHDIGDYHTEQFHLDTNWRSKPEVVRFNNDFFESARGFSKTYFNGLVTEDAPQASQQSIMNRVEQVFDTFSDVSQQIAKTNLDFEGQVSIEFVPEDADLDWKEEAISRTIRHVEELQLSGYDLRDMAILTRNAKEGASIAKAFLDYGNSESADPNLRYEVVSSEALFLMSSHVVRFVISIIKWLNNEKNTIVLTEWMYEYQGYILSHADGETIFSQVEKWEELVPKQFVEQKNVLKTLPLYELVEAIVRIFALNKIQQEFTYLQGFQDAILDYAKNERGDIPAFLNWWEESGIKRTIKVSDENNAIKVLTMHKAKGLEFPVVILPFLNWRFDHSPNNENILWCDSQGMPAPFNKLPVIPLKYESAMAKTYWANEYFEERLKAYLDNLNLLYVAFTRSVDVLIGIGKLPKTNAKFGTICDLLYPLLSSKNGWDGYNHRFVQGALVAQLPKLASSNEYGLTNYQSSPWRDKVNLQIKGSAELSEAVFVEATRKGIRMHEHLSRIRYTSDLEAFSNSEDYEDLSKIVLDTSIKEWFDPKWEVYNEVPILLPGGDFKRVDRINKSAEETVVIDYKTGAPRNKDISQVKSYMHLLSEMGHPKVSGYLVYLDDLNVQKV